MTIVDKVFAALGGYSGVMNEKLWKWLGDQGHTQGTLSERIASYGGWNAVMGALSSGVLGIPTTTNVMVEPISKTEIDIVWDWAGDEDDIDGFNVEYRVVGDPTWIALPDASPTTRGVVLSELTPDTSYELRVRAFDSETQSEWGVSAPATTPEDLSARTHFAWDFTLTETLSQDLAGETAVTADGDPVGRAVNQAAGWQ